MRERSIDCDDVEWEMEFCVWPFIRNNSVRVFLGRSISGRLLHYHGRAEEGVSGALNLLEGPAS